MPRWYRVFGAGDVPPPPGAILEHLNGLGGAVAAHFHGDETGWFRAELALGGTVALEVERFLASEEGIRAELNSWAAWVESCGDSPAHGQLMERLIQTAQLFTLSQHEEVGDAALAERLCVGLCRFLAQATGGIYQVDGAGFFAAGGTSLLREP